MKDTQQSLGLRTLEDISTIILHSHDLHETLDNIVGIVAKRMGTKVCSIYLLDKDGETLILKATKGLSRSSVNRVSMKVHEGLTGLVFEQRDMVMTDNAPAHPRYKYFKKSREEQFLSFLGLPLFEHKTPTGVIVIQTREARNFSDDEVSALRTISFQIGSIVANARLLDSIQKKETERAWFEQELSRIAGTEQPAAESVEASDGGETKGGSLLLSGIAASPGFCRGSIYLLDRYSDKVIKVARIGTPEEEQHKLVLALEKVRIQTLYMEKRVKETLSNDDAAIFHTHLMILEDRSFVSRISELIDQGAGAAQAVHDVVSHYVQVFSAMEDPYLRERAADMEDIGRRLVDAIEGKSFEPSGMQEQRIIAARDIYPSDLAMMDHDKILGIVTEQGNLFSHAAIMARSLGIPAVLGVKHLLGNVDVRDDVILDGTSGTIYIQPDSTVTSEYERLERDHASRRKELEEYIELPAVTTDGSRITLSANIGLISDVRVAQQHGAEGVGLYRTEFPYMARQSFPSREEQTSIYRKILESFPDHCVNIRTLDIGGDKGLSYFSVPHEDNPFLGWRSIRISLEQQDIFRTQLAGIMLAAPHGRPSIMLPMISSVDEIRQVKEILASVRSELEQNGDQHEGELPLGIMVEVPAAVQIIDFLIAEVDYVSIGTNDLIQYTLAADRNNALVRSYYDQHHPAVLHSISQVARAAVRAGKKASVCGEMAADPINALLLIGMGISELSLSAPSMLQVKQAVRSRSIDECRQLADEVLGCTSSSSVRSCLDAARLRFGL